MCPKFSTDSVDIFSGEGGMELNNHDHIMQWKRFPPFVSGIHWWSYTGPVKQNFDDFFVVSLDKLPKNNGEVGDLRHHEASRNISSTFSRCLGYRPWINLRQRARSSGAWATPLMGYWYGPAPVHLTHWGRGKMAASSQAECSREFLRMKTSKSYMKFHRNTFLGSNWQ